MKKEIAESVSLGACVSETTVATLGVVELLNRSPLHGFVCGNNHVADAFAVVDSLVLIA